MNIKEKSNGLLYFLVVITITSIFFIVVLSGSFLTKQIYIDVIPRQPMNSIKGIDQKPISYIYTEDKTYGNYIYLTNQFPISDEIGKSLEGQFKTFDFKIKFYNKSVGVNYEITLEKLPGTDLENDWIKVYLSSDEKGINCYRSTGRIKTYNEYSKYNNKSNEIVLFKGKVTSDDVKKGYRNYRFRMWVSEDVKVINKDYEKKSFIARVNVHATGSL